MTGEAFAPTLVPRWCRSRIRCARSATSATPRSPCSGVAITAEYAARSSVISAAPMQWTGNRWASTVGSAIRDSAGLPSLVELIPSVRFDAICDTRYKNHYFWPPPQNKKPRRRWSAGVLLIRAVNADESCHESELVRLVWRLVFA